MWRVGTVICAISPFAHRPVYHVQTFLAGPQAKWPRWEACLKQLLLSSISLWMIGTCLQVSLRETSLPPYYLSTKLPLLRPHSARYVINVFGWAFQWCVSCTFLFDHSAPLFFQVHPSSTSEIGAEFLCRDSQFLPANSVFVLVFC